MRCGAQQRAREPESEGQVTFDAQLRETKPPLGTMHYDIRTDRTVITYTSSRVGLNRAWLPILLVVSGTGKMMNFPVPVRA